MATLIQWNGEEREIHPRNLARGFTHAEIHALIGGTVIEIMSLADGRVIVIDPDAKKGFVNLKATKLFQAGRGTGRAIAGHAIVGCPGEIQ